MNWVYHVRGILETIEEDVEKVAVLALREFPTIADGYEGNGAPFDKYGIPKPEWHEEFYTQLRRRLGFGNA